MRGDVNAHVCERRVKNHIKAQQRTGDEEKKDQEEKKIIASVC